MIELYRIFGLKNPFIVAENRFWNHRCAISRYVFVDLAPSHSVLG